ncbi:YeiH family protein [Psychromicrobium lacuslunae]|uniref:Membrane protein n=1 Tax=Psychromicrobium lacuslunae TaxID=1618207 RepID=A0A0D4BX45_9MICC|nr:putative sulfate exporter family transporter [Psychromicrobium lacuslunae]AJT40898.1 membrane protein [Psychromicrobium lacuslunae]
MPSASFTAARPLIPGLLVSLASVALAFGVHALIPALPAMTVAVVFGILAANLPGSSAAIAGSLRPGLNAAGKHFMRAGIVLLGLKLVLGDLLNLGWRTVGLVIGVVLLSFLGTWALGKAFRLPGDAPLLIASGFSICGASAIGAMSSVRGTAQKDTVLPVALVTLCGTLAIGLLPLLSGPLGLTPLEFGQWVGASVHDVGQVVATAQTAGAAALAAAILIKLTRVMMLAPMVAIASLAERRNRSAETERKMPPIVPLFVIGFLAMMALRSTGWLSEAVLETGAIIQDVLLGAALFGLGSAVRVRELLGSGLRAVTMALLSWLLIGVLGFFAIHLINA